ncbi:hypothetical protein ACJMK2_012754, partial [Sinanodonta woodiana]
PLVAFSECPPNELQLVAMAAPAVNEPNWQTFKKNIDRQSNWNLLGAPPENLSDRQLSETEAQA